MPHRRLSDALRLNHRDSLRHYQMVTQGRPLWPIEWCYVWFVIKHVTWYCDSMQIRALMATASLGCGAMLTIAPRTLDAPIYSMMRLFPAWAWASIFLLHGLGAWWRLIERRPRVKVAFTINFCGLSVWWACSSAINLQAGRLTFGTVLEWCAIFLLACATVNTGRNEERGTP